MKVADLFVDISLKGGNKVADGLSSVKNWLTDISAGAIAAKAAILAAAYAIERMTKASGQFGNDVKNLSALTGIDTTKIQQWAEFMRRGGASAEDANAALLASSKTQAEIAKGNIPSGLGRILSVTHSNLQDVMADPLKFADMVKQYIQTSNENISLINSAAESVGFTPGAITGSRRNHEDPYKIKNNISSGKEIEDLSKVYQAWSDFGRKFEKIRDMFTAKFSFPLISILEAALGVATALASALEKVIDVATKFGTSMRDIGLGTLSPAKAQDGFLKMFGIDFKKSQWHPPMALPKGAGGLGKPTTTSQNTTINVYQQGIEDTHDSVSELKNEMANAFYSINTQGLVA